MRKFHEKKNLKKNFCKTRRVNTDFYDCVDDIFADFNLLLALDLGATANECICNIAKNVLTMNAIYNTVIKFLLKECA